MFDVIFATYKSKMTVSALKVCTTCRYTITPVSFKRSSGKEGLVQSLCPQASAISTMYSFMVKVELPNIDSSLDCYVPIVPRT